MDNILRKAIDLVLGSFDETALLQGNSDIIMVKWNSGKINSTPFLVCFGSAVATMNWNASSKSIKGDKSSNNIVKIYINNKLIAPQQVHFNIDKYGYIHPMRPTDKLLKSLDRHLTRQHNTITFQLNSRYRITSQIYKYHEFDRLLISDVDGTMTKDDLGGIYNNIHGQHYLHDGYYQLIDSLSKNNVKIVWMTMRSLPLYQFSKDYIRKHTQIHGPLLTQPQQLISAVGKQVMKKSCIIKTNMLKSIRQLFPKFCNPFIGGLGNRDNDAIAYRAAGMDMKNIFIVDTSSSVHCLGNQTTSISYHQMTQQLRKYFDLSSEQIQSMSQVGDEKQWRMEGPQQNIDNIKIEHKRKNKKGLQMTTGNNFFTKDEDGDTGSQDRQISSISIKKTKFNYAGSASY